MEPCGHPAQEKLSRDRDPSVSGSGTWTFLTTVLHGAFMGLLASSEG